MAGEESHPSPQLARVIEHLRGLAAGPPGDLAANRRVVDRYGDVDPSVRVFDAEVRPLDVAGVRCEWLLAPGADANRRLLYIHGGGWTAGGLDSHRPLSARLSGATGCAVLAVDYRLAPEHPFPAGLEDCIASYRWLCEHGPEGAAPARSVFVAGDSAGGNLTLALLLALKQRGLPLPNAAVPISPATDFLASGDSWHTRAARDPILTMGPEGIRMLSAAYLQGATTPEDPLASPLYGDFRGLPPLLFHVGDAEVLLDDSTRAAEKASKAGVDVTLEIYPDMPHVWHAFAPFLPEATRALEQIGAFVRKHG
jgi:monoterpene epsilon-lactone hydrolase